MLNNEIPSIEQLNAQAAEERARQQAQANKNAVKMRQQFSGGGAIPDPHLERRVKFAPINYDVPYIQQETPTAGIPEDWDYKTATNNWDGESLDKYPGAVGWTKYGEPYYGTNSPFAEFMNRNARHNRMWKDIGNQTAAESFTGVQQTAEDAIRTLLPESMGGYEGQTGLRPWQALMKGIPAISGLFTNVAPSAISDATGLEDVENPEGGVQRIAQSGVFASRFVGNAIQALGLGIDHYFARPFKQSASVAESQEELLKEKGLDALDAHKDVLYSDEVVSAIDALPDGILENSAKWIQGLGAKFNAIAWTVNAFKVWGAINKTGEITQEEFELNSKIAWNAGRVMYTSFIDPAAREEYKRRYLAGENPYLLELELENPLAEAVGEMIFDPTNFIFAANKAENIASTYAKSTRYLGEGVQEVSSDIAKLTNATDIVDDDLVKIAENVGAANARLAGDVSGFDKAEGAIKIGNKEIPILNKRGLFKLTAEGQQNHMERLASIIIGNDLSNVNGNPTEWYEIMKARAALASSDIAKRQKAIQYLTGAGIPMDAALSEGGLRFSNLIKNMYFDDAGKPNRKFLDGFLETIGNPELDDAQKMTKLQQHFGDGYTEALEKVFPKIREMEETNAAQKVLQPLEKIADREGVAGKTLGWVNSAASKLWMGLSPAFPFRNMLANKFQIFADFGVEGLRQSFKFKDNTATLTKIFGENVPEFMSQGFGSVGKFIAPMDAMDDKVKVTDWIWGNLKRSGIYEGRDRMAVTAYSFKKNWQNNGAKIVLNPSLLRQRGVSEDVIRTATNILDLEYGNWETAFPKILDALGEDADYFKSFAWLSEEEKTWMRNHDVLDNFVDGWQAAETEEDALRVIQEAQDQMREMAKGVDGEEILPDLADPTGRGVEFAEEAQRFEEFSSNDYLGSIFRKSRKSNEISEDSINEVFASLEKYARSKGLDTQAVIKSNPAWEKIFYGSFLDDTYDRQRIIESTFTSYISKLRKSGASPDLIEEAYRILKIDGAPPVNANARDVATYLFENVWWPQQRNAFAVARDEMATHTASFVSEMLNQFLENGVDVPENLSQMYKRMVTDWQDARMMDYAITDARRASKTVKMTEESWKNYESVLKLAFQNGVSTGYLKEGVLIKSDKHLLNIIKKYTGQEFENIRDIPLEIAQRAFDIRQAEKGEEAASSGIRLAVNIDQAQRESDVADIAESDFFKQLREKKIREKSTIEKASGIYDRGGSTISNGVPYMEAMPELEKRFDALRQMVSENFGKRTRNITDSATVEALKEWGSTHVKPNAYVWRSVATDAARALGDFVLHDYGSQRNIDLILGLIYPYQFWYSRTYAKWLQRIAQNPAIVSQYFRYKEYMAKIHAGLPEFYKYQINTNELFGMDSDHPLYFNLESTLNPLNGITGVDFDDPDRRVDWWTTMLDGIGRFGPSINPLLQYGTALALMAKGEDEAASHWGGRLLQQTSTVNTIGAMTGFDWLATTEFDPAVNIFSKGEDPWMAARIGRAAYAMQEEGWGGYTPEEIFDAIREGKGPIYDEAKIRAIQDRGWGQLSSYFFGVGFKARSPNDIQIDQMYQELYGVLNMRENLSPNEYKQMMQELNHKYPYMDTILTSKKVGTQRDSAYAWSVLGRIPPGDSFEVYGMVGMDDAIVDQFYKNKGDLSKMTESDRDRFMSAIVDIAAVLAIPDGQTQQSWDTAKLYYGQMQDQIEFLYGEDIWEKIDTFYAIRDSQGDEVADSFLYLHPEISRAMDIKKATIVNGPLELQAYYSGVNKIESYYKGLVFGEAKMRFGNDIFDLQTQYFATPPSDRKTFLKEHPKLEEYWDFKNAYEASINQHVATLASRLPVGAPAVIRQDFNTAGASVGAQNLYQEVQQPGDIYLDQSPEEWQWVVGDDGYALALRALSGDELSYSEEKDLEYYASLFDMDADQFIQYIGISTMRNQGAGTLLPNIP
ncbi:hypothetical protein KQH61_06000 [bacterium]|nr:hypothetical protein [bacterium]